MTKLGVAARAGTPRPHGLRDRPPLSPFSGFPRVISAFLSPSAGWAQPFDPRATTLRDFFVDERRAVRVPMRKQKARPRFLHDPEPQCSVLHVDLAGDAAAFFIFPRPGKLGQLEDGLLPKTLIKWDSSLRTRWTDYPQAGPRLLAQPLSDCHPKGHCRSQDTVTLGALSPAGHSQPPRHCELPKHHQPPGHCHPRASLKV